MASISVSAHLARMGYARARQLMIAAGLLILGVLLAVLWARSVDTIEVVATLLFAPIFVALLLFGFSGGVVGAVLATGTYVILRADAIDAVGFGEFSNIVVSRGFAYMLFGAIGGWASSTLEMSLDKLDLYDQIDDQTGVNNARFLLQDIDLEKARSERYKTIFSVSFVDIDAAGVSALGGRRQRALLRELGRKLEDGVRTMDRVAHGHDGMKHRIATVLPETAGEGATVFHDRLVVELAQFLATAGVQNPSVEGHILTIPGDDARLDEHLALWRQIDSSEHAISAV